MSQFVVALSVWIHALATVVFVGHYLLLSTIYLPVLAKGNHGPALSAISRRSRPWLYASLLIFFATGIYLMVIDPGYLGFMDVGNLWGVVMLVKHLLILVMIGLGFWYNAVQRVGPRMQSNTGSEQAIATFRRYSNAMALSGVLVLLLTAMAQAA